MTTHSNETPVIDTEAGYQAAFAVHAHATIGRHQLTLIRILDTQHGTVSVNLALAEHIWHFIGKLTPAAQAYLEQSLARRDRDDADGAVAAFIFGWVQTHPERQRPAAAFLLIIRDQLELIEKTAPLFTGNEVYLGEERRY